jgi:DNA-damage-inducible protein J
VAASRLRPILLLGELGVLLATRKRDILLVNYDRRKVVVMATTTMVHVRVDEQVKAQAAEALAAMGLTVSDAVRVFLTRVAAEKQLPFTFRVPNVETRAAMKEADEIAHIRRDRFATAAELFDDLEKGSGK